VPTATKIEDRDVLLLKLKAVEPLIQCIEGELTELRRRLLVVEVLHPGDPGAQAQYLSQLPLRPVASAPAHSLIRDDLDAAARDLGEEFLRARDRATDEVMRLLDAQRSVPAGGASADLLGPTVMVSLRATVRLMGIGLRPALHLRARLLAELGLPSRRSVAVDTDPPAIIVNGERYPSDEAKVAFVALLLEARGAPVASGKLNQHPLLLGVRVDRLRKTILEDDEVPIRIEAKPGTGYWIPVE
jgi:hypothetical protein